MSALAISPSIQEMNTAIQERRTNAEQFKLKLYIKISGILRSINDVCRGNLTPSAANALTITRNNLNRILASIRKPEDFSDSEIERVIAPLNNYKQYLKRTQDLNIPHDPAELPTNPRLRRSSSTFNPLLRRSSSDAELGVPSRTDYTPPGTIMGTVKNVIPPLLVNFMHSQTSKNDPLNDYEINTLTQYIKTRKEKGEVVTPELLGFILNRTRNAKKFQDQAMGGWKSRKSKRRQTRKN